MEIKLVEKTKEEIEKEIDQKYPEVKQKIEEILKDIETKGVDYAEKLGYKIAEALVRMLLAVGDAILFALGTGAVIEESAKQHAYEAVRITIPDVASIISSWRKGVIDDVKFKEYLNKLGYDDTAIEVLLNGFKRNLEVGEIIEAFRRGLMDEDIAESKLAELGLTDYEIDLLLSLGKRLLNPTEIINLWLRGRIDDVELEERLRQHGYTRDDVEKIKELAFYIPSVTDLIELAVKEAFDDEKIRRLGLDANVDRIVEKVGKWARAQGLSEEWLKRYWYAHWRLPSVEQGINMYFRGLISYDDLKELIVALDYPPYWVEKLLGLAQAIPTRVDLRRFIENNLADFDYVVEQYKKQGYSEDDAIRLAKLAYFTVTESERNKLRNTIIAGFKDGWISEDEAREMLKDIFIPSEVIDLLIQNAKLEIHKEQIEAEIKAIHSNFIKGIINDSEMFKQLIELGLNTSEAEFYRYTWLKEKQAKQKAISKYDLEQMVKYGIIDKDTFIDKMVRLGYSRDDAELLYQLQIVKAEHGR